MAVLFLGASGGHRDLFLTMACIGVGHTGHLLGSDPTDE